MTSAWRSWEPTACFLLSVSALVRPAWCSSGFGGGGDNDKKIEEDKEALAGVEGPENCLGL